ncbi:pyridoxamine 5'-phosphate oxidase family protein [Chloroflexota bacterium]
MNLDEYFESAKGRGVLATADKDGQVNLAMYARPYFMDDDTVTFIMAERLTHENLKSNPYAAYLFSEEEQKYQGKRIYLKKTKEEKNPDLIAQICRKCDYSHYETKNRYVVYFDIKKVLPLIGSGE